MQVARLSQTRLSKKTMPFKLCYYGEVVRKRGTMLRPERQFLQIGAECIGENSFLADVEILELAYKSLSLVGIKDITLEISSRVFLDRFFTKIKNSPKKNPQGPLNGKYRVLRGGSWHDDWYNLRVSARASDQPESTSYLRQRQGFRCAMDIA